MEKVLVWGLTGDGAWGYFVVLSLPMKIRITGQPVLLVLGDIVALVLALWLTLVLRYADLPSSAVFESHLVPFSVIFLIWLGVYFIYDLYSEQTTFFQRQLDSVLSSAHIVNSIIALAFFYFIPYFYITPKTNLFLFLLVSFVLLISWRRYLAVWVIRGSEQQLFFACAGVAVAELVEEITTNPLYRIKLIAEEEAKSEQNTMEPLVVINTHDSDSGRLLGFYNMMSFGARFITLDSLYETVFGRVPVANISERWFLESVSTQPKPVYDLFKRLMDILIAGTLGLVTIWVYPLVWILVKLGDGGGLFSIQERVGQNNRPVKLYKFRTMEIANDGGHWQSTDNQVTRLGSWLRRSRIDELPQLWNVIKGDLSLIGPRPEFAEAVRHYSQEIKYYNIRHLLKPGLSGWAQIYEQRYGGEQTHHTIGIKATKNKLSYDIYYLKNRNILLDLKIALKTIRILLSRSGI